MRNHYEDRGDRGCTSSPVIRHVVTRGQCENNTARVEKSCSTSSVVRDQVELQ